MKIITSAPRGYSSEKVSDKYIELNSCGINGIESEDAVIIREKGRADFHFLYVFSGRCRVYKGDGEILLSSGDAVFFYPFEMQKYYFEKTGENKVYWAHFTGSVIEEILCECGFSFGGVYKLGYSDLLISQFDKLIAENRINGENSYTLCNALLHSIIAEMGRLSREGGHADERRKTILRIATKMEYNLKNIERIDDYAAECNLSRDRFVHLFKEVTGWSPYRYMMNIRIEKAERLLRFSSSSVSEIALALGFDDPLYFSRIFKKYAGKSPAEYRKNIK